MNPAWSVIFFTTLAGWAQGVVVALAAGTLAGLYPSRILLIVGLGTSVVLALVGLGASALHLGRPERAWRSAMMWRTSWLSREVIALPAFIGWTALWLLIAWRGEHDSWMPLMAAVAIVLSITLWVCTAMIYSCLKFIREWAHPLTLINYLLMGLASGALLAGVLALLCDDGVYAFLCAATGLLLTLIAFAFRVISLVRNAKLRPVSTLQSATGIRNPQLRQISMGMTGGAFNTREFFHHRSRAFVRHVKSTFILLAFVAPIVLTVLSLVTGGGYWLLAAVLVQYLGLLAERWFFFAEARHPQNLYYQMVS